MSYNDNRLSVKELLAFIAFLLTSLILMFAAGIIGAHFN